MTAWNGLPKWQQTLTVIVGFVWYATQVSSPHNQALELIGLIVKLARMTQH
jgi:hypothetical protein